MLQKQNSQTGPMNWKFHWVIIAGFLTIFGCLAAAPNAEAAGKGDTLYIGNFNGFAPGGTAVASFDAQTGASLGAFIAGGAGGLRSPNGLVFDGEGHLLVADQKVNLPVMGEILRYAGNNGAFIDTLVSSADPNAPFSPDGIVVYNQRILFVADLGDFDGATETPGKVSAFNAITGAFLGNLEPIGYGPVFHPRGVVIGPDGKLYVSTRNLTSPLGGDVLRFDPDTFAFLNVFVSSATCNCDLNRPDGLVFRPNGWLYITSFRADANGNDKILVFKAGKYFDKIDLAKPENQGGVRAFAQAILFGPQNKLFVPISTDGSVRSYNVSSKKYDVFIPPGSFGDAGQPRYLTFGKTDPATLQYRE